VNDEIPPAPLRPLLTVGELLRLVPVGPSTLNRLIESGQLPAIRIGRRRFFDPSDVERLLRSCSARAAGADEAAP
jgi:excisionase family DNA binding protein